LSLCANRRRKTKANLTDAIPAIKNRNNNKKNWLNAAVDRSVSKNRKKREEREGSKRRRQRFRQTNYMRRKQNFENKNKRVFQKAKVAKRMVAIPSSEELTKTFMHKISQTLLPHFSHVFLGHSGVFRCQFLFK